MRPRNELSGIPQPASVCVDGRVWCLFSVDYDTADGTFSTYIYAINSEHAGHIVSELRETARLSGQVLAVFSADGKLDEEDPS